MRWAPLLSVLATAICVTAISASQEALTDNVQPYYIIERSCAPIA